jgi:hypothetical protein
MEKIKVPLPIMNLMIVAAERGYKDCESGKNLQAAFMSIHDMFEVEKPQPATPTK